MDLHLTKIEKKRHGTKLVETPRSLLGKLIAEFLSLMIEILRTSASSPLLELFV